jgi:hypothetical protein
LKIILAAAGITITLVTGGALYVNRGKIKSWGDKQAAKIRAYRKKRRMK